MTKLICELGEIPAESVSFILDVYSKALSFLLCVYFRKLKAREPHQMRNHAKFRSRKTHHRAQHKTIQFIFTRAFGVAMNVGPDFIRQTCKYLQLNILKYFPFSNCCVGFDTTLACGDIQCTRTIQLHTVRLFRSHSIQRVE